jgi:hypothetical protein
MERTNKVQWALLMAMVVFLSGCSQGPDGEQENGGPGLGVDDPAPPPTDEEMVPPQEARIDTGTCEVEVTTFPFATVQVVMDDRCDFTVASPQPTEHRAAIIEVVWDELQPTILSITASVQTNSCNRTGGGTPCTIAEEPGTSSPLRIELSGETYEAIAGDEPRVRLSFEGAALDQPFSIHVSLSTTGVFPEGDPLADP